MNELKTLLRIIILFNVGIILRLDAGTVQRIYIQNNAIPQKGHDVKLVCEVSQFGNRVVNVYKSDSVLTDTSGISSLTACLPSRCTKRALGRYSFSPDSSHVYIDVTNLTRSEDQKWWTCAIEDQRKQLLLTTYTIPRNLYYDNLPSEDQDLVQKEVTLKCKTECLYPQPSFTWFYNESGESSKQWSSSGDVSETQDGCSDSEKKYISTLHLQKDATFPDKMERTVKFICGITSFPGMKQPLYSPPSVKIQFAGSPKGPPTISSLNDGGTLKVIEGDQVTLSCSISGGNPLAALTWNCFNNGSAAVTVNKTVTRSVSWTALRHSDRTCSCHSDHPVAGKRSVSIKVENLYPPTKPSFWIKSATVSDTVNVIRNNPLTVSCNSSGKPIPSYKWMIPTTAARTGSILSINSVMQNGRYTCDVQNSMRPTYGSVVAGSNSSSLDVHLLYPPKIDNLRNKSAVEGFSLTFSCPVTVGNPSKTTYQWKRTANDKIWHSKSFTIDKLSRNDAMFYTCTVYNTMTQIGETAVSIPDTRTFYLNVWYSASVIDFFITGHKGETSITMNELDVVLFECLVDRNPGSTVSIMYQETMKISLVDTKALKYNIKSVMCTDRGTYDCLGFNQYSKDNSSKMLNLLINCSPRPSPLTDVVENLTSALHTPAAFSFTTLAYPKPNEDDFRWFKWNTSSWLELSNGDEFKIETIDFQSKLTITDVNGSYFGTYKLEVRNTIGSYGQIFHLMPEDAKETTESASVVGGAVGGSISGVVIIAAVAVAYFLFKRSRIKKPKGAAVKEETQSTVLSSEYSDLQPGTGYINNTQEYADLHLTDPVDTILKSDEMVNMHSESVDKIEARHAYTNLDSNLQKRDELEVYENLKI